MNRKLFTIKTFGNSMLPFLANGDILSIKRISFRQVLINDLITFKHKNRYVTHRVIYKNIDTKKPYLITKGDNNPYPDEKVYPDHIVGRLNSVKRHVWTLDINDLYFYQSSLYIQEIIRLKNIFSENGIDFLILKGLPLHLYYEKKIPGRIYADCDILINKTQFPKVEKLLKRLDYQKTANYLSSGHKKFKDKDSEIQFTKSINNFLITFDIHLEAVFLMTQLGNLESLYPQKLLDQFTGNILKDKRVIRIFKDRFPILSKENLVIYLALHLFHHNFTGYHRYELLRNIFKAERVDYPNLSEIINSYKLNNFTYPVFLLLEKYYLIKIPKQFLNNIKPNFRRVEYIKNLVSKVDIFSDEPRINSGVNRFRHIYHLSPQPFFTKLTLVANSQFIYSLYFVAIKKLQLFYYRYNFLLKQKVRKLL